MGLCQEPAAAKEPAGTKLQLTEKRTAQFHLDVSHNSQWKSLCESGWFTFKSIMYIMRTTIIASSP